ncbi:MAG: hypothetical protein ABH803_03130 [Candidatus Micrarchaeota archaeon]
MNIKELEKIVKQIQARNARVENEKGWETSWARKIVIFILTYAAITIYFYAMNLPNPSINAIVPALAFVISTLSLPFFKKIWLKHFKK